MAGILWVLFFLFFPVAILELCYRVPFLNKLGTILIAYIVGLVIGNSGLLPEGFTDNQELLTTITIPLALPLLLFGLDVKSWFRVAGRSMLSMLLALISILIIVISGFYIFYNGQEDFWKISGMLVGVYTGGTPNLASIQLALDVEPDIYIMAHTFDMLLSAIFLFFLISIGKSVFRLFLPDFHERDKKNVNKNEVSEIKPFYYGMNKNKLRQLLMSFLASVLILAAGAGLSEIVSDEISMLVAILVITSFGIAASFIKSLKQTEKTFDLGMYFILVFSLVVASMADISQFGQYSSSLFFYITFAVFGTLVLHVLFSAIFKIDTDTVMITSTALICSPPFVPMIAGALKNKHIIISGLTIGIIGYAMGNYLGITIAYLLK